MFAFLRGSETLGLLLLLLMLLQKLKYSQLNLAKQTPIKPPCERQESADVLPKIRVE